MKQMLKFLFLAVFVLTSCAPSTNERDFSPPEMDLKPDWENDPEFARLFQSVNQFEMEWNGQVSTAEVHEVIQGILDIAETSKNKNLRAAAGSLYKKYYAQAVGTRVSFFKTPYYEFFQNEALPDVRQTIADAQKQIGRDLENVKRKVKEIKTKFQWPQKAKYRETMDIITRFLDTLVAEVPKLKLMSDFEVELIKAVKAEKKFHIDYLDQQWAKIDGIKTLTNILKMLQEMVNEFDIDLDADSLEKIESGKKLAIEIDAVKDEGTAFKAIIAVWLILSVEERKQYVEPISADLYKFLKDKPDQDLKCLVDESCFKFFNALVRDFGVLPQIKKFGWANIQKALNENTHAYVLLVLEERLLSVVKSLDQRVERKIEKNVAVARDRLETTRRNAQGFTKDRFLAWLKKNLSFKDDMTMAYEFTSVLVDTKKKVVTFKMPPSQNQKLISAQAIGASLGSNAKFFESGIFSDVQLRKPILEQINRIMGFGGLPGDKAPSVGIVNSFENETTAFDIGKVVSATLSYGLTDKIELKSAFLRKATAESAQISAVSQIELGNGLLATMKYLRDWQPNSFDKSLGGFKASSVFGSDAGGGPSTDPVMFSKTDFFGMTAAQFINWILNLTKNFSQVGLITDQNEIVWLSEYEKNRDKTLLFGVYVDVVKGQRSVMVQLEPMVKLIRLLKAVELVVNGIEKTKFPELLKKAEGDPECQNLQSPICPTLAQVISRRVNEIKRILIPLGNTIATKFRKRADGHASGSVFSAVRLPTLEPVSTTEHIKLMDQLYAIEGLINVYESTKIESYLWAAKETYFNLQKYYNPKTNFFDLERTVPTIPNVIQMIRSFKIITPHIEETERIILKEKIKIWEYSLEKLR